MDLALITGLLRLRRGRELLLMCPAEPPAWAEVAPAYFDCVADSEDFGGTGETADRGFTDRLLHAAKAGKVPVLMASRWRVSEGGIAALAQFGFERCITSEATGWRDLILTPDAMLAWRRRRDEILTARRRFLAPVCKPIDRGAIHKEHGAAWFVHCPELAANADDSDNPDRSSLILFEDGQPLGPSHSDHHAIREMGNGRYSHWVEHLYFSVPGQTDPTENRKAYEYAILDPAQRAELNDLYRDPDAEVSASLDTCLDDLAPVPCSENPDRIVLLIGSLGAGGAERQLCTLAIGLKQRGWDVRILTLFPLEGASAHFKELLAQEWRVPVSSLAEDVGYTGADLDAISPLLPDLPEEIREMTANCYARIKSLDPAMLVCYLDLVNIVGGMAAALAGVPRVLICARSVAPHHYPHIFRPWLAEYYTALENRENFSFAANSNAGARSYEDWLGLSANTIQVVRNGLAPDDLATPPEEAQRAFRESFSIPHDAPLVAGILRFTFEKRPLFFLEIIDRLRELVPNLLAVIAGDGPMADEVAELHGKLGLEGCVHLLGRRDDVPVILTAANILLHVSSNEGFPNVLMEAQWLARAVVCTRVGGMLEALSDDLTPFAREADDIEGLAQSCAELLGNADMARRVGALAKSECAYRFSAPLMVQETLELLQGDYDSGEPDCRGGGIFSRRFLATTMRYFAHRFLRRAFEAGPVARGGEIVRARRL